MLRTVIFFTQKHELVVLFPAQLAIVVVVGLLVIVDPARPVCLVWFFAGFSAVGEETAKVVHRN